MMRTYFESQGANLRVREVRCQKETKRSRRRALRIALALTVMRCSCFAAFLLPCFASKIQHRFG
jgi:hypothetical protein